VGEERVASRIDEIVRKIIAEKDLKAVIAGVAVSGEPVLTKAWGESMTGVPATQDMHFRNGSVAIAYLGVLPFSFRRRAC
jgi:CubicO group peptidase (beta-lactamase class C family)